MASRAYEGGLVFFPLSPLARARWSGLLGPLGEKGAGTRGFPMAARWEVVRKPSRRGPGGGGSGRKALGEANGGRGLAPPRE